MGRLLRGTLLLAGCLLAARGSWALAAPVLSAPDPRSAESLLLVGCAGVLLGCVGWLVAVTTLTLTAYVVRGLAPRGRIGDVIGRVAERGCPALVTRAVATCLGVAVTAGVAAPVLADPGRSRLDGLAIPDRQAGSGLASAARPTAEIAAHPAGVVVRPGDSLWAITARLLPSGASDAAVTAGWQRLHHANRNRLGPDPDLIQPGTRLRVPLLTPPRRESQ